MTTLIKRGGLAGIVMIMLVHIHCTPKSLISPEHQTYLTEETKYALNCTVNLKPARNNGMGSILSIQNKNANSRITITPDMVTLTIADTLTIPAVNRFSDFIYHRMKTANKACDSNPDYLACRNAVTDYFAPFLQIKGFKFGSISPQTSQTGAIAFDLLDPTNTSAKAKQISHFLKANEAGTFPVVVRITIKARKTVETVLFPLQAEIVQDRYCRVTGFLRFIEGAK